MKLYTILILILLLPLSAFSYVPRAKTIVQKMSNNNGSREYKIVREVQLESAEQKIKAREVWTVAHGDKMKLEVSSLDSNNPWKFVILYSKTKRETLSQKKQVKSFKKSADFFEPLFHDRYSRSLMNRLVGYQFIPEWVKNTPPPSLKEGQTTMTPEPFVQLSPMEGSVTYAIGSQSNSQGGKAQTRLWVEQDSFLIRKGRLRSRAEFANSKFQTFVGGLMLPGEQTISWGDKLARVKLLAAERTKASKKDWTLTSKDSGTIPTNPLVKEFYSRFR